MEKPIIQVEKLTKVFKKSGLTAVDGVTMDVAENEFFAFLGPNGAGKSTVVKMLTTLLEPTSGIGTIAGFDIRKEPEKVRDQIGVALQETGIDPDLTGRELLHMQARLFGFTKQAAKDRTIELLNLVDLSDDADRKCGNYSGGMRRRLDLAMTLVHRPKILFLDEPTTGLDPTNRKAIWDEIKKLNKQENTTIFLTTQYLEEADQLADRISIINKGKIIASGTADELKRMIGQEIVELTFNQHEEAVIAHNKLLELTQEQQVINHQVKLYLEDGSAALPKIIRLLDYHALYPAGLNILKPTLDDVFLKLTGEEYKEEIHTRGNMQ